jgi:hypothetical protein
MRVLVVHADIIVRCFFLRELRRRAEVLGASTATGALAALHASRFEVLLTSDSLGDRAARALLAEARSVQPQCRRGLLFDGAAPPRWGHLADRCFSRHAALVTVVEWIVLMGFNRE